MAGPWSGWPDLSEGVAGAAGSVEEGGVGVCADAPDANPPPTARAVAKATTTRARAAVLSVVFVLLLEESLWDKDDVVRL